MKKSPIGEFSGSYEAFEWDDAKRVRTLQERGLDFADVARLFFARSPFFRRMEVRGDEVRWQAFGPFGDPERLVSVVYTEREGGVVCRIISVRAASNDERKEYHAAVQAG
ncbi:MAG TPA: BrnT family toxin [Longimicrobium sp.]|nr:BrnT family toxin [Longimicrobium sp.]